MIILLFFAFLSGIVTIFAPCIWPLLPIILSASTTGGHRKPLGITIGIITSFSFFTLAISYLVSLIHLDPNSLRLLAVIVISLLGLAMIVPGFMTILEGIVSRISGRFMGPAGKPKTGFLGGFITGLSLGIVWSPCAGPILATIATLAATQAVNVQTVLVTLAYAIGVGIPLFLFSTFGSLLFKKSRLLSKYTGRIQQVFGIIMLLTALAILTNYDKVLQVKLLDLFPSYSGFITKLESNDSVTKQLNDLKQVKEDMKKGMPSLPGQQQAPEFVGITNWLNTDHPLTMSELKGKVVLVDFWTYTCINCIRTLPFVTKWYDKYKDQGFVVIGVHTPEFAFEKETSNVEKAIKQFAIHYPVAQDNNYGTWNAYNNQYWPAHYLIDAKGVVRETHFGEGNYAETEKAIQDLLKEAGKTIAPSALSLPDQTPQGEISPETYFGAERATYFFPNGQVSVGKQQFTLNEANARDSYTLGGDWEIDAEMAKAGTSAKLAYYFRAQNVYAIFRPLSDGTSGKIKVYVDGKPISKDMAGSDVVDGIVTVDSDRLYHLVKLENIEQHRLRLEFLTPGINVYTFTFG